jgi:hypothetical protein
MRGTGLHRRNDQPIELRLSGGKHVRVRLAAAEEDLDVGNRSLSARLPKRCVGAARTKRRDSSPAVAGDDRPVDVVECRLELPDACRFSGWVGEDDVVALGRESRPVDPPGAERLHCFRLVAPDRACPSAVGDDNHVAVTARRPPGNARVPKADNHRWNLMQSEGPKSRSVSAARR